MQIDHTCLKTSQETCRHLSTALRFGRDTAVMEAPVKMTADR